MKTVGSIGAGDFYVAFASMRSQAFCNPFGTKIICNHSGIDKIQQK